MVLPKPDKKHSSTGNRYTLNLHMEMEFIMDRVTLGLCQLSTQDHLWFDYGIPSPSCQDPLEQVGVPLLLAWNNS